MNDLPDDFYVCVCAGVAQHDIDEALDNNCKDLDDLIDTLRVCTGCTDCRKAVNRCIEDYDVGYDDV